MAEHHEPASPSRCPTCGFEGDGERQPGGTVACPSCGQLWESVDNAQTKEFNLPERREFEVLGQELIGQLASGNRDETPLEGAKLKTTEDDDAGGTVRSRKKKRPPNPKRLERQIGWDEAEKRPKRVRLSRWRRWRTAAVRALGTLVLLALAVLLVYAVAIAIKRHSPDVAPSPGPAARNGLPPIALETAPTRERREIIAKIEAAYQGFLAADSLAARLGSVRHPDRVRPLMEQFHQRCPIEPFTVRELPDGQQYRSNGSLAMTTLLMGDYSTRSIAVQRLADGEFKVDWESFVGHCEIPWEQMPVERPTEPFLVRAMVSPSNERDQRWPDGLWRAWQLEDRDRRHRLIGFSQLGARPHIEIGVAINESRSEAGAARRVPLTLRIAFPRGAPEDAEHVEIVELLTLGWVYPTDAP